MPTINEHERSVIDSTRRRIFVAVAALVCCAMALSPLSGHGIRHRLAVCVAYAWGIHLIYAYLFGTNMVFPAFQVRPDKRTIRFILLAVGLWIVSLAVKDLVFD